MNSQYPDGKQDEEKSRSKGKCGKCRRRLRKCLITIGCEDCKKYFHYKCKNETKNVVESDIKESRWKWDIYKNGGEYNEEIKENTEKLGEIKKEELKMIHWKGIKLINSRNEKGNGEMKD